jgi:hypothetical protein
VTSGPIASFEISARLPAQILRFAGKMKYDTLGVSTIGKEVAEGKRPPMGCAR